MSLHLLSNPNCGWCRRLESELPSLNSQMAMAAAGVLKVNPGEYPGRYRYRDPQSGRVGSPGTPSIARSDGEVVVVGYGATLNALKRLGL